MTGWKRSGRAYIVEDRQALDVLAKSNAAGVRTYRHAKLCRHQQHRQNVIHAGLQQLLEYHSILAVLAGGDADGRSPRE